MEENKEKQKNIRKKWTLKNIEGNAKLLYNRRDKKRIGVIYDKSIETYLYVYTYFC